MYKVEIGVATVLTTVNNPSTMVNRPLVKDQWLSGAHLLYPLTVVIGLNLGGLLTFMKNEYVNCLKFFDKTAVSKLTTALFEDLMTIEFSAPVGSNLRREEEAVARTWLYFLRATEGYSTYSILYLSVIEVKLKNKIA